MNEFDTLEKEVYCETCKYFDIEYEVCRHPIAIKGDVGEKDSCILWCGCWKDVREALEKLKQAVEELRKAGKALLEEVSQSWIVR